MATSMGDDDRTREGREERLREDEQERDQGPDLQHDPEAAKAANRFDIRRIIGGVFLVYGVVLTVVGIVGSSEVKNKAAGINVNLWTGLAMLVVGAAMVAWALLRPVAPTGSRPGTATSG